MSFTKYTGTIHGVAGELITALDTALVTGQGWDNTFAGGGATKKIYRPPAGNRYYLRVDDNGTGTGGAKEALIRGAETWTDIDTPNLNPFPSDAQSALTAHSLVARKSADAGTARSYKIFADDRTFYMLIPSDTAGVYQGWAFGDFYSIMATPDSYRTFIVGKIIENTTTATGDRLDVIAATAVLVTGHFIARAYTGLGTSVANGLSGDPLKSGSAVTLAGLWPYPNAADGGAYMSQLWVVEPTGPVLRGRMRGFWEWCHPIASITDGDTLGGTGTLTGRTFEFVKQSGNAGVYLIETSNTLETN